MAETSLTGGTVAALGIADIHPEEVALPRSARRRELVTRVGLVAADVIACTGVDAGGLGRQRRTLHDLGRGAGAFLRAAGEDGRALRPRPVHPAQDDAGRGAARWWPSRRIFALVIEGVQALEFTGRSHPLLLWGLLVGAARRGAARSPASWRCASTGSERLLVIGDAAAHGAREAQAQQRPGLNATVVGRVSGEDERPRGLRQAAGHDRRTCRR